MFAQASDSEKSALRVGFELEDEINHICNATLLIQGAVDIVNRNGA